MEQDLDRSTHYRKRDQTELPKGKVNLEQRLVNSRKAPVECGECNKKALAASWAQARCPWERGRQSAQGPVAKMCPPPKTTAAT